MLGARHVLRASVAGDVERRAFASRRAARGGPPRGREGCAALYRRSRACTWRRNRSIAGYPQYHAADVGAARRRRVHGHDRLQDRDGAGHAPPGGRERFARRPASHPTRSEVTMNAPTLRKPPRLHAARRSCLDVADAGGHRAEHEALPQAVGRRSRRSRAVSTRSRTRGSPSRCSSASCAWRASASSISSRCSSWRDTLDLTFNADLVALDTGDYRCGLHQSRRGFGGGRRAADRPRTASRCRARRRSIPNTTYMTSAGRAEQRGDDLVLDVARIRRARLQQRVHPVSPRERARAAHGRARHRLQPGATRSSTTSRRTRSAI